MGRGFILIHHRYLLTYMTIQWIKFYNSKLKEQKYPQEVFFNFLGWFWVYYIIEPENDCHNDKYIS